MADAGPSTAAAAAASADDLKTPLLDAEEGGVQEKDEEQVPKPPARTGSLLTVIPVAVLVVGSMFCLIIGLVTDFIPMHILFLSAGLVGLGGGVLSSGILCSMGGMRHQFYRFRRENDRLFRTSFKLRSNVEEFESTNQQLSVQVDALQDTVGELQGVSDGLHSQLGEFGELRESMQEFAKESGQDITETISGINGVYDKVYGLSLQNERILLLRAAQDVEFLDRKEGWTEPEFQRFLHHIPSHLRERFEKSKMTFDSVAGDDHIIDHREMVGLIDTLLAENEGKLCSSG